MEWYFANDGDDLVVPKDREAVDRLPSPNSWSDWGISDFPKKNFDGNNLCEDSDLNISSQEMECSSNSTMNYGFNNNLQQWATRQSDYQLCDLSRMDQMDDIYLNSLVDEDLVNENLYGASSFSPDSQYGTMSNISTDWKLEPEHAPFHSNNLRDSNYIKKQAFSPTEDWNREFGNSFPSVKAPVLKDSMASEQDNETDYMHDQTSLEQSVLQELESVTAKLNVRTRNCFRDSLYRLAENSRKKTSTPVQNGDLVVEQNSVETVDDAAYRVEDRETSESRTNAVDRAIANLMFTKMDFYVEDEGTTAEPLNLKSEADKRTEQFQYNSNEPWASCFTMLVGDAEVPIAGK